MKDKKFFVVLVALVVSLGFNVYLITNNSNAKGNDITAGRMIQTYMPTEKEDYTLIKSTLEKFEKDKDRLVLTEDGQNVTKQHENKLLEFHKKQDYKGAKDYVLKENISLGYSDDNIQ